MIIENTITFAAIFRITAHRASRDPYSFQDDKKTLSSSYVYLFFLDSIMTQVESKAYMSRDGTGKYEPEDSSGSL